MGTGMPAHTVAGAQPRASTAFHTPSAWPPPSGRAVRQPPRLLSAPLPDQRLQTLRETHSVCHSSSGPCVTAAVTTRHGCLRSTCFVRGPGPAGQPFPVKLFPAGRASVRRWPRGYRGHQDDDSQGGLRGRRPSPRATQVQELLDLRSAGAVGAESPPAPHVQGHRATPPPR